jgi:PKHD-type hydroxylase
MNHKPIWLIGQLPEELCDKAIKEFMLVPAKAASMGEDGSHSDNSHRNTTVRFISPSHWLTGDLFSFGGYANKESGWDYAISGNENIQFAEYAVGQHYGWHVDNFPLGYQKVDRKVTVVTLLSDPADYEGGDLFVKLYQEYKPELKKGSVIAFPSILEHMVTPVTKGVRYSAAMWINGPCFR